MAQLKMTLADVRQMVSDYFASKKVADPTWVPSKEEISGLIQKVMKEVVIDGNFNDKLPELDGDILPFGQAIEEFYTGLVPAIDYNDNESNSDCAEAALKPYRPTFDEVCYSERLGRKKFKTTIDYEKYNEAFTEANGVETLTNLVMKRLYDSLATWRYGVKKGLLGTLITKAEGAVVTYTPSTTIIKAGHMYTQGSGVYVAKKNLNAAVSDTLATLASQGVVALIENKLVANVDVPTDTASGEAAIQAIQEACEDASFVSSGTSLSGSTIGAEEGLVLYVKKGVMPAVKVQTLSGAFQKEELAVPASIKVVDDFGQSADPDVWAVLADPRGIKLHNNYRAVREDANGDGDYINYTLHNEDTGFISTHTFVRVFKSN